MLNVKQFPEYACDSRNVQALDYIEHYKGAHDGNTSNQTIGFYDVSDGKTKTFFMTIGKFKKQFAVILLAAFLIQILGVSVANFQGEL